MLFIIQALKAAIFDPFADVPEGPAALSDMLGTFSKSAGSVLECRIESPYKKGYFS